MNHTSVHSSPSRPGIYSRGSDTVDKILKAALHVLIEEGAAAFTLPRIARECGLKVGNVSHYFPRKEMLVKVMLDDLVRDSERLIESTLEKPGLSAEEALSVLITATLDDLRSKRTTHLFTELWAMSNHNEFVADRMNETERFFQRVIGSFVAQLNPALAPEDVEIVSLFISGSVEGMVMFSGFGKPWGSEMPQIKAMALKSLVQLAKSTTPAEIHRLRPAKSS